ncbi:PAS domain S-box protein [Mucilaginibacter sp.]|uniref:PAS domain-containing sensor histidine kinase n=1 Tax=Mucilaginibacter sp. TaxID=1882438 RepID=UPI0025D85955|nr:PAS domain S-box protein [Mucilaginibacter sp.]
MENTSDLVYSIDRNFDFITYNQPFKNAMKLVYNFDLDYETNTLTLLNGLPPEVAEKWMGIYNKAFDGETVQFVNEYPFGGAIIYLSYSVNPIWESGKVIGLSCFSRDITRQKLDEAAIKKSAANLTAIIENSDASIYSVDTELRFITFNKLFTEKVIEAYNVELEPGDSVLDFLKESDPEQALEWERMYIRALSGKSIQFTKGFQITGAATFITFSINPIWENDAVIGLSCTARDITKQITDEMAIRKSEASLRTVFNNTDMACLLIDTGGNIISFNTLAKKFMNEQSNIVIKEGYPILDCVDENRKSLVSDILNKTKNGTGVNYQLSRETNGVVKWFDLTWAGIKDNKMQDFGHIFTVRDITEKKKLETEREKITADLIQRNKALEQFTYIISHNLRAPVANIIGLSSLISNAGIESDELPEVIKSISRSANKLDNVILDLNQILQINEDINENIQQISLPKLIEDIKFSIRHMVEKEHASIAFDFGEVTEMLSVKSFIHSIFYNLILNSIKYRKPGTDPMININAKSENGKIQIIYKDNGRGIDTLKYANELFGLYKRFDTSVEGKGIGLFMVKMQVESLGGTIRLQSELNKGTEFIIEFPQAQLQTA